MKEQLLRAGVAAKDITLDYAGFRTLDSIFRVKYVFDVRRAIIVTQRFHASRSQYIAQSLGVDSVVYVAEKTAAEDYNRIRESLARVKAFVDISFGKRAKFSGPAEPISLAGLVE